MGNFTDTPDWTTLPIPRDDGSTQHLMSQKVAAVSLPATDGRSIDLSKQLGRIVVYAYPRTGRPDVPNPKGWDSIPGARGCSPQSCAFRDHFKELQSLGVAAVFGL